MKTTISLGILTAAAMFLASGMAQAADVSWINPAGGNWGVAANWSTGAVPGPEDRALIKLTGTYTVTLNVNATVAGLELGNPTSGTQILLINSSVRTLTLNGPSTILEGGLLRLTSGTVTGTGDLTISDTMEWAGGTLSGSGKTLIASGGAVRLSGSSTKTLNGRTTENRGMFEMDGTGTLTLSGNALLENHTDGLLEALADANISSSGTPRSTIQNAGTFRRTSGNGTIIITTTFNHGGVVEIKSGLLQFGGTGTAAGVFDVAANTTLRFAAAYDLSSAAVIQGAGRVEFTGGNVVVEGTYNITGSTAVTGGSANFSGSVLDVGDSLIVSGSSTTANFTTNPLALTDLTLSGGTLANSAQMTIAGSFNWTGGTLGGSGQTLIQPDAELTISATASRQLVARSVDLEGTGIWRDNSTITMSGGAEFNVKPNTTLEVRGDATLATSGTPRSVLNIEGTLLRSTSTGLFRISSDCNNTGVLQVTSGSLNLQGGGTGAGEFTAAAGTTLRFGANYVLTEASRIASDGTVDFNAGTLVVSGAYEVTGTTLVSGSGASVSFTGSNPQLGETLTVTAGSANLANAPITVKNVNLSAGTISGTGVLTIAEKLTWTSGTFSGTGTTYVPPGATLAMSGGSTRTLSARTLSLAGSAAWIGNAVTALNTQATFRIEPGGSLELQGSASVTTSGSPASRFVNAGTVIRNTGAGTFTFSAPVSQAGVMEVQTGTLRFTSTYAQTAGALRLAGGALTTTTFFNLQGGEITGSGTVNGAVGNGTSLLRPAGIINVIAANGWTNAVDGVVQVKLGGLNPGTEHDQLTATGRAVLGGTLRVNLNPGYQPSLGDWFEVLRFGSVASDFATYEGLSLSAELSLKPTLSATSLVLTVVTASEPNQPVFGDSAFLPDVGFRLRITEAEGRTVIIDASVDLLNWAPISTNLNSPALLEWIDADALQYPRRFYRSRID